MTEKQKKIQIFLLIIGILLILVTYFYFPYKYESVVEKNLQEEALPPSEDISDKTTSFESLEYQGLYDLDKTFLVKSEKAHINEKEPDIVHMTNMHVILYLTDGRVVNILSDKGTYNKANYDCFFEQNVRASDGETKIFSENLELSGNKNIVSNALGTDGSEIGVENWDIYGTVNCSAAAAAAARAAGIWRARSKRRVPSNRNRYV